MLPTHRFGVPLPLVALAATLLACAGSGSSPAPPPEAAVAVAGPDQDVTMDADVTLDGTASSDPAGDHLAFTWTQVHGPDVTRGAGVLKGAQPTFTAPHQACTLVFELRVDDGNGASVPATVQVNVLEDPVAALWVDGDAGSDDAGDGSRIAPYASIRRAIQAAATAATPPDIYIRARSGDAAYDESAATLELPSGVSLFGGYGAGWIRNTAVARSRILGASTAIHLQAPALPTWLSGLDVTASGPRDPSRSVAAVLAEASQTTLVIEDNVLAAGDVGGGEAHDPGTSYGVALVGQGSAAAAIIRDNLITSGMGGDGAAGAAGNPGVPGTPGIPAYVSSGGGGGASGTAGSYGGDGGDGGTTAVVGGVQDGSPGEKGDGLAGGNGGSGGSACLVCTPHPGHFGGDGGRGDDGADGTGGSGAGSLADVLFESGRGFDGAAGSVGSGGGGGGGGGGAVLQDGGGGGGGGQGGTGGEGGAGGAGGGASVGIWLVGVAAHVEGNTITTSAGGLGAPGGEGGAGGPGGPGGIPANPAGNGKSGGQGGAGGPGGIGGHGGGGAGGPSYGILVGRGLAPLIVGNTITTGPGGAGANDPVPTRAGQGGHSYGVFDADLTDGDLASVFGNTITPGIPGSGGSAGKDGQGGTANF